MLEKIYWFQKNDDTDDNSILCHISCPGGIKGFHRWFSGIPTASENLSDKLEMDPITLSGTGVMTGTFLPAFLLLPANPKDPLHDQYRKEWNMPIQTGDILHHFLTHSEKHNDRSMRRR
jgi:hypothetical protein